MLASGVVQHLCVSIPGLDGVQSAVATAVGLWLRSCAGG
jgi:hypothetical protein